MLIAYSFQIRPTGEQEGKMFQILKLCRHLYNRALAERRDTYRDTGKSITYLAQANKLPRTVHSQVLQDTLKRLDRAYKNFFEGRAGFPQFKDRDHYRSFTYPQVDVVRETFQREGFIYLSKIGFVKIIAHRPFEDDRVFQINVIRKV